MRLGLPPIAYEVGTEEVHGGLVDLDNFRHFIDGLRPGLERHAACARLALLYRGQGGHRPAHDSFFDPHVADELFEHGDAPTAR